MQQLFLGGARQVADEFANQPQRGLSKRVHTMKDKSKITKSKFIFQPPTPLEKQTELLYSQIGTWNRGLAIKGYKGTFKIENWITIETKLRDLRGLQSIGFVDTQLDKEHLEVMSKWLSWIQPHQLVIEFQQNELDNEDFHDFLYFLFDREIDIKSVIINYMQIYIMGNPGIYKGVLLQEFKLYLKDKYAKNMAHFYKLIKDTDMLSIAIIKIDRKLTDSQKEQTIKTARRKINQTQYYRLNVRGCFTEQNWKGFQDLILTTYKEDNLEQLAHLDISDNYLGPQSAFNNMCESISSAKGLLVLKIGNQPLINNSSTVQLLMGNRYDTLKLNELDISDNKDILEKTFKLLSDNIFKTCQLINFSGSLTQQLSTLFKLFVMTEAFAEKTKESKLLYRQCIINNKLEKIFRKDYLQVLDLSSVENYNRHDLVEKFLINTVFTEFSNISKLHGQNMDVGRCQAYVKTIRKFKDYMSKKQKEDSFFANYKLSLKHFVLPKQSYRMEIETMKEFFLEYLFTVRGSIVEIEAFDIEADTFRQANRAEGLQGACDAVIQRTEQEQGLEYSVKKLSMSNGDYQMNINSLKCFLFTSSVKLNEFHYEKDSMPRDWEEIYDLSINYLNTLKTGEFHSLRILKLIDIFDLRIQIHQFMELFIFDERIKLEELEFRIVSTEKDENSKEKLLNRITNLSESVTLKKLCFGEFDGGGERDFLDLIVFNKLVNLETLIMRNFSLGGNLDSGSHLEKLRHLEFDNLKINNQQEWQKALDIFFFKQRETVKIFQITSMELNQDYATAMNILLLPYIQEIRNNVQTLQKRASTLLDAPPLLIHQESSIVMQEQATQLTITLPFTLHELTFKKCSLADDFLSGFLVVSELRSVSLLECTNLQLGIPKCVSLIKSQKLEDFFSYKIKSFNCEGTQISDKGTFLSLIKSFVLNTDRQILQSLNLSGCQLTGEMIELLAEQLQNIKDEQKNYNRVFLLRDVNLSKNSTIPAATWSKLWDVLLNENKFEQQNQDAPIVLEQSQVVNTIDQDQDSLVEETLQLIQSNHLYLKEKILYNYNKFTPQFPKQLLSINLKMDYTFLELPQQQHEYYRIIVGYIIHPESLLKELELSSLNLNIFIKACLDAYEFSKQYLEYSLLQSKQAHKSQIKSIKFNDLKEADADSLEKFLQIFLCNNHIELNKLTLTGGKLTILKPLLGNLSRRENYVLEELHLPDIDETLQQDQAEQFLKYIVFGEKTPLKFLSCSPKFNINIQQLQRIESNNGSLSKLKLKYDSDADLQTIAFYNFVLERLLVSNLKELEITANDATSLLGGLFEKLSPESVNLEKLTISGELTINKQRFEFIGSILNKLKLLKVTTLKLNNDYEIYEACQLMANLQSKCKLDIKEFKCSSLGDGFKKLIFNPNVGFTDLVLRSPDLFSNIQIHEQKQSIRYLNLSMDLLYNSGTQLSENALTTIGKMLIYNEESALEELVLHQCHFKMPGLTALMKQAGIFKELVEKEGRQGTAQLKLKRMTLYYSLYIGNDGAELLAKNLIYYEYINIERFEVLVTNWNDAMTMSLSKAAQSWILFQQQHNRKQSNTYPLRYLDIGRNEFVEEQETWSEFLKTFVFTDRTPHLETLNIHFMALNDLKVRYIVNEARLFFDKKPPNYKFSVKRINFSQNNSLTHVGWDNLFRNFFFHPKVYLEELNMISTMLDSKIKLEVIAKVIQERALKSPNKKVPMHTFLCYNISLKDFIFDYLSEQPANYKLPVDLPVEIEYTDSRNIGNFDGVPESYGEILQIFQRTLELRSSIVYKKDWKLTRYKYSPYHLNICDHYLKILNQYYEQLGNIQVVINLNLQTLDMMASYFRYIVDYPGEPYPYNLLFQQVCFDYFAQPQCNIFTIKILQKEFPELEQINQLQVLRLWENVKNHKTSLDQIQVEYYLNDDLIDEMFKLGYDESDIVSLVRIIPPSKIRIQNSLSIQAIKGIYSILYDTYYFQYAMISYGFDNFLNIGIGYALREIFYNYQAIGPCRRFLKNFLYNFFNFFVQPTKKYIFNDEVKALNKYLSKQRLYFFIIVFVNLLFFAVTLGSPYVFTHYFNGDELQSQKDSYCLNGPSKQAAYLYYSFAGLTAIVESILYYKIAEIVPSFINKIIIKAVHFENDDAPPISQNNKIMPLEKNDSIVLEKTQPAPQSEGIFKKMKTTIKSKITNLSTQAQDLTQSKWGTYLAYLMMLISSQLYKFDLFNDVVFILNCYYCGENIAFTLALIITAFSQGIFFIQYLYFIGVRLMQNDKTAKLLSSKFINDFYRMSFLGRNSALTTLLDSTAPFNVIIIPNTTLGRYIFPHHAGRAMSNLVKSYFFQFLFEDLPQTALQAYFVVSQSIRRSGKLQVQVYISIAVAIFTALSSFYKFLSIRPTNLLQNDFDILSSKQQKLYKATLNKNLKDEKEQIEIFSNLYSKKSSDIINIGEQQTIEERETLLN